MDTYATKHVKTLKKFAFQMLDMNCDGKICETDIFSFMEMHNNDEFFRETFLYDM